MKKLIVFFLLFSGTFLATKEKAHFLFSTQKGLISLKGAVNEEMKDYFLEKIMLDTSNTFFVYIDSPGGSVYSMNHMIEHMENSGKKFICVAKMAASAAFMLLQFCDERYMLPNTGVLMSHNAKGGVRGDFETMKGQLKMWDLMITKIEKKVAKRMKLKYSVYKRLIANELWMNYELAKKYNAIDSYAHVSCTSKLVKQKTTQNRRICSLFGGCKSLKEVTSACPILNKVYK